VKLVPGEEFETNNRMVAATKLQDGDMVVSIQLTDGRTEAVLQTTNGVFLRFDLEEISTLKKNSKGVRGIKLGRGEELEQVYLLGTDSEQTVMYKEKQVHLNRLKIGKRDGKGSKVRF
ncbi:DNA gyrase C-terminal beta-propeller domain-containing protein, partial [[Clostridium] symbiosum]